jgi:hypothetical protein
VAARFGRQAARTGLSWACIHRPESARLVQLRSAVQLSNSQARAPIGWCLAWTAGIEPSICSCT